MNSVESATKILDSMLGLLGIPASIEVQDSHDGPCLQIHSNESKAIIGRDGDRLDDLQYLTNRILRKHQPSAQRIKIDCEHFRSMREDQMATEIQDIANQVKKSGNPHQLRPLNAYYRRMVYHILSTDPDVLTESPAGEDRLKRILISPKSKTPTL